MHARIFLSGLMFVAGSILVVPQSVAGDATPQVSVGFPGAAYHYLLGRAPTSAESQAAERILGRGDTRAAVAATIVDGQEYQTEQVVAWYKRYLLRSPTTTEIKAAVARMATGSSFATVQAGILGSSEFFSSISRSNASQFARNLISLVLMRSATPLEIKKIVKHIKRGIPRTKISAAVLSELDARDAYVSAEYLALLGRAPVGSELQQGATIVAAKNGYETLPATLVGSDEFEQDAINVWLNAVFPSLLGRPPQPSELTMYGPAIFGGMNPMTVATAILGSDEYRTQFVGSVISQLLQRPATQQELTQYVAYLHEGGTDQSFEATIMGTPEYFSNRGSDSYTGFVDAAFGDVVNRLPSADELQTAISELTGGVTPEAFAYSLITGAEAYDAKITAWYQSYLGRTPTTAELSDWLVQLDTGNATEEGVMASIVCSEEYWDRL